MVREVNAVNFRQNLGEMISHVQYRNDSVLIKKSGKPVAALIDPDIFNRIRLMWDRFEHLTDKLAKAYADVPEEDFEAEVQGIILKERDRKTHK